MAKRERQVYLKTLIFGPPKVGKTVLAGSAHLDERMNPVLILDFEGGLDSLMDMATVVDVDLIDEDIAALDFDNEIAAYRIQSWEDYEVARDFLRKGDHPFQTVVLDSITEANEAFFLENLQDAFEHGDKDDPDMTTWGDYTKIQNSMGRILRLFVHLPMHVILIAHDKERLQNKLMITGPALLPKRLAGAVAGMCNQTVFLTHDAHTGERMLLLDKEVRKDVEVGGRYGTSEYQAPSAIYEPTATDILDVVLGMYEDVLDEEEVIEEEGEE
jgi:hypothetical protein